MMLPQKCLASELAVDAHHAVLPLLTTSTFSHFKRCMELRWGIYFTFDAEMNVPDLNDTRLENFVGLLSSTFHNFPGHKWEQCGNTGVYGKLIANMKRLSMTSVSSRAYDPARALSGRATSEESKNLRISGLHPFM